MTEHKVEFYLYLDGAKAGKFREYGDDIKASAALWALDVINGMDFGERVLVECEQAYSPNTRKRVGFMLRNICNDGIYYEFGGDE